MHQNAFASWALPVSARNGELIDLREDSKKGDRYKTGRHKSELLGQECVNE